MRTARKVVLSMFFLRITVLLVMLIWTIDKFVNPGHATRIFEKFYAIAGVGNAVVYILAFIELIILVLFFFGIKKKYTYGLVFVFHGASTLASFPQYLSPFEGANLLFFAAWPMLAACSMLFFCREDDTLFQVGKKFS